MLVVEDAADGKQTSCVPHEARAVFAFLFGEEAVEALLAEDDDDGDDDGNDNPLGGNATTRGSSTKTAATATENNNDDDDEHGDRRTGIRGPRGPPRLLPLTPAIKAAIQRARPIAIAAAATATAAKIGQQQRATNAATTAVTEADVAAAAAALPTLRANVHDPGRELLEVASRSGRVLNAAVAQRDLEVANAELAPLAEVEEDASAAVAKAKDAVKAIKHAAQGLTLARVARWPSSLAAVRKPIKQAGGNLVLHWNVRGALVAGVGASECATGRFRAGKNGDDGGSDGPPTAAGKAGGKQQRRSVGRGRARRC